MAAIFAFKCSCCGKIHEGSPSLSYDAPMYYNELSDHDKEHIATLTADLCTVTHEDRVDYFARVILEVPIEGAEEPFTWGVWVSLSAASFERYTSSWGEHDESDSYFGWFSNALPGYEDTINLKTNVRPRKGGLRPYLELHEADHQLLTDFRLGLSVDRAQAIAEKAMHVT